MISMEKYAFWNANKVYFIWLEAGWFTLIKNKIYMFMQPIQQTSTEHALSAILTLVEE